MKYIHSLLVTGFLISFLPMNAEEVAQKNTEEQQEEAALTSLDEELARLDEEFEEFKEELYSLESELQQQDDAQKTLESLLKPDEGLAVQTEELVDVEDAAAFTALAPELEDQAVVAEVPVVAENEEMVFDGEELKEESLNLANTGLLEEEVFSIEEPLAVEPVRAPEVIKEATAPVVVQAPAMVVPEEAPAILNVQASAAIGEPMPLNDEAISVDLKQAFSGSPVIYSLLLGMSVLALGIWFYSILSLRSSARVTPEMMRNLQNRLSSNHFEEALSLCQGREDLFSRMMLSGIHSRRHGLPVMIEAMKAEGKRVTIAFWQKIGLLNDIAIIAPMLGLLGTVLGMFYAFYDVNRSIESVSTLFDGLGISVGTTVAGLIVAILALILHSTAKYRLVRALALVENEAQSLATLIDDRTSLYKGS
jgi:biopolymer transport protein ExbB